MRQSGVRRECTRSRDAAPTTLRSASSLLTTCLHTRKYHQGFFCVIMKSPAYWTCYGNCSFQVNRKGDFIISQTRNASAYYHSKGIPMIDRRQFFEFSCKAHRLTRLSPGLQKRAATDSLAFLSGQTLLRTLELPFSDYECLHSGSTFALDIFGDSWNRSNQRPMWSSWRHTYQSLACNSPQVNSRHIPKGLQPSGSCYDDVQGFGWTFEGTTKSLNVADLECPTLRLGPGTNTDGKPCRTIGAPYLPLTVPPPQVLSLDLGG